MQRAACVLLLLETYLNVCVKHQVDKIRLLCECKSLGDDGIDASSNISKLLPHPGHEVYYNLSGQTRFLCPLCEVQTRFNFCNKCGLNDMSRKVVIKEWRSWKQIATKYLLQVMPRSLAASILI